MPDLWIAAIVIGIIAAVAFDFLFLRWLRRRPGRKFDLRSTPANDPPCWVYGWPDDE
jgi:hypothetical protein